MVSFIIDDEQIATLCHFTQHAANPRFITFRAAFIYRATTRNLFFRFPAQTVPVVDQHFRLSQLVVQTGGNDLKLVEVVSG